MDVSPNGGGAIKVNQNTPVNSRADYPFISGESVRLEAVPAPGYNFNGWSGSFSRKDNPVTVVMDCNKTVTANFSKPGIYKLTLQVSGNGSTNPQVGTHSYTEHTRVAVEAIADRGWKFDSWSGDVADPKSPATTVILNSNKTLTANFSRITHKLTMQVNGKGVTTPPIGYQVYNEGTIVTLKAVADRGWKFDSWTGNVADARSSNTMVIIGADEVCTANFSRLLFTPWRIGGAVIGVVIIAVAIWLIIRRRSY